MTSCLQQLFFKNGPFSGTLLCDTENAPSMCHAFLAERSKMVRGQWTYRREARSFSLHVCLILRQVSSIGTSIVVSCLLDVVNSIVKQGRSFKVEFKLEFEFEFDSEFYYTFKFKFKVKVVAHLYLKNR